MKISGVQESIEVVGTSPIVETARSLSANTLNHAPSIRCPSTAVGSRTSCCSHRAPLFEGSRGGVSIGGQRGINCAFTIDGASYDNPFFGGIRGGERSNEAYTISQEAISGIPGHQRRLHAPNSGVRAAASSTPSPRAAPIACAAAAFWYFRDEAMTADDPSAVRPPTSVSTSSGLRVGGPDRRDRTHFFVAWDQQQREQPVRRRVPERSDGPACPGFDGEEGTFIQTNDVFTLLGRVDHQINSRHHASMRVNRSTNEGKNGLVHVEPDHQHGVEQRPREGRHAHRRRRR